MLSSLVKIVWKKEMKKVSLTLEQSSRRKKYTRFSLKVPQSSVCAQRTIYPDCMREEKKNCGKLKISSPRRAFSPRLSAFGAFFSSLICRHPPISPSSSHCCFSTYLYYFLFSSASCERFHIVDVVCFAGDGCCLFYFRLSCLSRFSHSLSWCQNFILHLLVVSRARSLFICSKLWIYNWDNNHEGVLLTVFDVIPFLYSARSQQNEDDCRNNVCSSADPKDVLPRWNGALKA